MPKRLTKPKPPPVPPPSLEEAVDAIEQLLVGGTRDLEVIQSARDRFPEFAPLDLYQAAIEKIRKNAALPDDVIYGWCIAATMQVYRRARLDGEQQIALAAVKQIAALQKSKPSPPLPEDEPGC
jgi:hypothetical protein